MFLDYGDDLLKPLGPLIRSRSAERNIRNAICFLRLVQAGEMDVAPQRELVATLCKIRLPAEGLEALPSHVFRAAWKECARRSYIGLDIVAWLDEEVVPVFNWYLTEPDAFDHAEKGRQSAQWVTHRRRWRDWLDAPAAADGKRRWPGLVPGLRLGAFVVRELCDESGLHREAEAMSHCVDGYVGDCLLGVARIFSITDKRTGVRVATLSLEIDTMGNWVIGQVKGKRNADVTALRGIDEVAMALLRCVEDQQG